jgi:hypothetical protein
VPIVLVCASVRAVQIGGTSMGMYSGLFATEFDSHANMAVAGSETMVIARSGMFANVTPFSKDLPAMDMVEIGDAAMCYDDPISLVTYILVMKNALLIPSMGHNLIPPFLIWEAGLIPDETPKHQTPYPTIDNHSIWDQRSGLRIHLQLNGIFSYFKTWPLTLEEQENWEDYQVVYVNPDGDSWDPYSEHFADEEAAMVDVNGLLVERDPHPQSNIFNETDISKLYGKPVTCQCYEDIVNKIADDDPIKIHHLTSDDLERFYGDGIRAQLASLDGIIFSGGLSERAHLLHVSMAIGSMSVCNDWCEIFEAMSSSIATAFATLVSVTAGKSNGVTAEQLSKVFCIPHDDAVRTLSATTQLV